MSKEREFWLSGQDDEWWTWAADREKAWKFDAKQAEKVFKEVKKGILDAILIEV